MLPSSTLQRLSTRAGTRRVAARIDVVLRNPRHLLPHLLLLRQRLELQTNPRRPIFLKFSLSPTTTGTGQLA